MKKRIFVAINLLPKDKEKIKEELLGISNQFSSADIRFLKPENWHLTLSFLGYQDDQSINLIIQAIQQTAAATEPVRIKFEKIIYGPPGKPPRMIWITSDKKTSDLLGELKKQLEDALENFGVRFKKEKRPFSAHITLARFFASKKELPSIEKNLIFEFKVESLDLMESTLRRSGAEYDLLAAFPFKI